ncbi:hypothetical protein Theam_1733 (plasmid) [Thermovibrio ammonificans HB-1]|uniref:Lytic transglycosylase catalytic n=1 Tax=Thermovibrio ammonificans (strain DSM 15698 / JCM 12110 / HB-1) TaxID=648996 RepID=E8T6W8_THEA1|nr:hypothetical protein Theam_1733 [Thermovibrio ammonificans HB-1]
MLLLLTSLLAGFPSASALTLKEAVALCPVPYAVMWAISKAEVGRAGYPYVIRINSPVRVEIPWLRKLGENSYDCKSYELCVYTARELIKRGFRNIDLGPFQINYAVHRFPPEKAFLLPESYLKACQILVNKVKKHGWSWEGIATYHSTTPKYNRQYALKLQRILSGLEKKGSSR